MSLLGFLPGFLSKIRKAVIVVGSLMHTAGQSYLAHSKILSSIPALGEIEESLQARSRRLEPELEFSEEEKDGCQVPPV